MDPFSFHTKYDQTILLGRKARNLKSLLEGIQAVPENSIYYHTHRFLLQHHFLSPEPPNDFAYWVAEVLNDDVAGEKLSSGDIVQYDSIGDVRTYFATVLEEHLQTVEHLTECPRGEEFHFMACRSFVLTTPYVAANLGDFVSILSQISISALYFHVFDAKLRLKRGENDFSRWFSDIGYPALADEVRRLDPYTHTMEGLRSHIMKLVQRYE